MQQDRTLSVKTLRMTVYNWTLHNLEYVKSFDSKVS